MRGFPQGRSPPAIGEEATPRPYSNPGGSAWCNAALAGKNRRDGNGANARRYINFLKIP